MKRVLWQGTLVGVLVFAAILGMQSLLDGGAGQASPATSLGVDADPSGNTATSLGSIDSCVSVDPGDTFTIDVFIGDVEDLQVWHVFVRYDPSVVNVSDRDVDLFLAAAPGSDVRDYSYGDPGVSGAYDLLASDVASDPSYESGSGVLARLTLTAVEPGLTVIGIEDPVLWGSPLHMITVDSVVNAWVAVGEDCPSEPAPTPTPSPTPVPTPTPSPTPSPTPPATPSVGVDVDPGGNTATSLGPIDSCLSVSTGTTFDVDIFIEGATRLRVWNVALRYDPSVVTVVGRHVQMLLAANAGSDVVDYSYGDPDVGGAYELTATDLSEQETAHETGSGVLARLTLEAVGPGLSPAALSEVFLFAYPAQPVAVGSVSSGQIAVDRECGLDGDRDGWPDEIDNCPQVVNPDHTDTDGDSLGDSCDPDDDNDGVCDPGQTDASCTGSDNCQWVANPNQEDRHPNGIGDHCEDADGDGFTDYVELYVGADCDDACSDEPGDLDAWPPDINVDTSCNVFDLMEYIAANALPSQQGVDPEYHRRLDLTADGEINVFDLMTFIALDALGTQCTNP